jgi:hypothetical protein
VMMGDATVTVGVGVVGVGVGVQDTKTIHASRILVPSTKYLFISSPLLVWQLSLCRIG